MRVLVTGAGSASGICTILALKESSEDVVYGCDCSEYSPGLHLAHHSFIVPVAADEDRFMTKIINRVKELKIDVIFPNVDEELLVFARNKSSIPANIIISPLPTIEICHDKSRLMSELETIVPLPTARDRTPPLFIKPRVGRGSRNGYQVNSTKEMNALLAYLKLKGVSENDLVIQEYLPGREYTVDALFDTGGNLVVAVPRQRARVFGGASLVGITERNNQLVDFVEAVSKKLSFWGPVNLQFKEDRSKTPRLTEINPRCAGGMAITRQSGVNLPRLAIRILSGDKIPAAQLQWQEKTVFRYMTEIETK